MRPREPNRRKRSLTAAKAMSEQSTVSDTTPRLSEEDSATTSSSPIEPRHSRLLWQSWMPGSMTWQFLRLRSSMKCQEMSGGIEAIFPLSIVLLASSPSSAGLTHHNFGRSLLAWHCSVTTGWSMSRTALGGVVGLRLSYETKASLERSL